MKNFSKFITSLKVDQTNDDMVLVQERKAIKMRMEKEKKLKVQSFKRFYLNFGIIFISSVKNDLSAYYLLAQVNIKEFSIIVRTMLRLRERVHFILS